MIRIHPTRSANARGKSFWVTTVAAAGATLGLLGGFALAEESPAEPTESRVAPWVRSVEGERPALGYRYAALTPSQRSALRRRVRLPLDVLARVREPRSLIAAVEVAPLPPLDRPLVAAGPATPASGTDPFDAGGAGVISFKRDPMGALGALLGATAADGSDASLDAEPMADLAAVAEDPAEDPFAAGAAAEAEVAPSDDGDDFSFGGDDDPFADF